MKTALIYSSSSRLVNNLSQHLGSADYAVECATGTDDIAAILKRESRDVVIAEARKDQFAYLMRLAFVHNAKTIIHFFEGANIFCFYPMRSQPTRLVNAIGAAGLRLSPRLLQHTRTTHSDEPEVLETIEI